MKTGGIKLQNTEPAKEILLRIEYVVVVNLRVLSKNPALRVCVRLGWPPLNLVVEFILALVGIGQVSIVEQHQRAGQGQPCQEQRYGNAKKTHAASLDGDNFVVFAHDSQRHKHRDQPGQGRQVIAQVWRQVPEIILNNQEGYVSTSDVVEELKERECFKEKNEYNQQHTKVENEFSQNVEVHQPREAAARRRR